MYLWGLNVPIFELLSNSSFFLKLKLSVLRINVKFKLDLVRCVDKIFENKSSKLSNAVEKCWHT